MEDLSGRIVKHPNVKFLILELLNGTASFLFRVLSSLNGKGIEEVKGNLRETIEGYLCAQKNLAGFHLSERKTLKDFLDDERTLESTMAYLLKTFSSRYGDAFPLIVIALWISLERKEEQFEEFVRSAEEPLSLNEALYAFWVFG